MIKEIAMEFEGRGDVRGFMFRQLHYRNEDYKRPDGRQAYKGMYMYEVRTPHGTIHYEVFERRVNNRFLCITYPTSKSFGRTAKCFSTYKAAYQAFCEGVR